MAAVTPTARVPSAAKSSIFREVSANDTALPTVREAGLNCADFDEVVVVATPVLPCSGANIEPHFWSPNKDGTPNGGFVPEATPVVMAMGTGARKVFRVAHTESVFFEVTGMAGGGGAVRLEVSGVPVYGRME
jgi:hypothetical protein